MFRLPCTCHYCITVVRRDLLIQTCAEIECVCGTPVNLEIMGDNGWATRYRCAKRLCGFSIEAENPYFMEYVKIISDARDYLVVYASDNACECGKIARIVVEMIELNGEKQLQFFYVCPESINRCTRKFSLLDYVILTKYGSRCPCFRRTWANTLTDVYECINHVDGCGYACHRKDSVTFAQIETTFENSLEGVFAFPKKAKDVCLKPGILKFQYDPLYTRGQLVYRCRNKMCKEITSFQ